MICPCIYGQAAGSSLLENPPGFHAGTVIVARQQFTKEYLTGYFETLLKRPTPPLVSIWVFTSDADSQLFWSGKWADHIPYRMWRTAYDTMSGRSWEVARFLAVKGSGILSISYADGKLEFVSLGAPDATGLLSADGESRILHVTATSDRTAARNSHATIYIRSQRDLSSQGGLDLLARIGDLPFHELYLGVRRDPWFISSLAFPAFYPFDVSAKPPSHEEYRLTQTMTCLRGPKPPYCTVWGRSGYDRPRP